jgi:Icc-related predicted phosphoesterase
VRLVLLSDTHTFHEQVTVPEGDILIHAGDMALEGSRKEVQSCLDWLNKQPHEHIVAIAGNHDFAFERPAQKAMLDLGRVVYLEDSSINIDGKTFYGSPWQPEFCSWAFNVARGSQIKHYWDMIPDATDVLITHGPPMGILDQTAPADFNSVHLGCEDLIKQVEISKPLVHTFGHIHGGAGQRVYRDTLFVNASVMNEAYKVVNTPFVVDI